MLFGTLDIDLGCFDGLEVVCGSMVAQLEVKMVIPRLGH